MLRQTLKSALVILMGAQAEQDLHIVGPLLPNEMVEENRGTPMFSSYRRPSTPQAPKMPQPQMMQ